MITHVTIAAKTAAGKLDTNIVAFDVGQQLTITDVFLIISARDERQVGAVVDAIGEQLIKQTQLKPTCHEDDWESRWVLLGYVNFVVHIQCTEERGLYSLERLWKDCPQIPLDVHEVPVPQDDEE